MIGIVRPRRFWGEVIGNRPDAEIREVLHQKHLAVMGMMPQTGQV